MEIRELMTRDPEACLATESCAVAVNIMRRRNCGFVPVVDGHVTKQVIGVVTDQDIALYLEYANRRASEVSVKECMTTEVKTIRQGADLNEAARMMEQFAVHQLPVIEDGQLVGVLSLKDIAVAANKRWAYPQSRTAEQKLGEILEAIASARE